MISVLLQVGDQLGDKHAYKFAQAMATKLIRTAWTDSDDCEALKHAFVSLNSNLKLLVVRQIKDLRDAFENAAKKWPLAIQQVRLRQAHTDVLI